jgi:hypothetical protein
MEAIYDYFHYSEEKIEEKIVKKDKKYYLLSKKTFSQLSEDHLAEFFEMGKYYTYWGWIDLDGNLVFPTKEQKDSKENEYSHSNILPNIYEYQALQSGWLKFFIEKKTPKKLEIYGYLPNDKDRIVKGVENIINSIVRGIKKDVFGENINLPDEISWFLRTLKGNKKDRREIVKRDDTLRRLRNSLKEPSIIKKLYRNIVDEEKIEEKIVKKDKKYFIFSKDGKKKLGGPYTSKKKATKRLSQIEFFKHLNK